MNWTILALGLGLAAPAPLTVSEPTANLGEVRAGPPLRHRFVLHNPGDTAITITAAQATCGCLSPRLAQTEVGPGQSTTLEVEVRTFTQPTGDNQWHVDVRYRSGSADEQTLRLHLLAKLTHEIKVEPSTLTLSVSHPVTHDINLTDCRPTPLQFADMKTEVPGVSAKLVDRQRLPSGHWRNTLRVTVSADCPVGQHAGDLVLTTADAEYPELRVPLRINRREPKAVTVSPDTLRLTTAVTSGRLLVRGPEGQPVRVAAVDCDDPAVTCQWAEGSFPVSSVRVTHGGLMPALSKPVKLRIRMAEPADAVVEVPITVGGR